MKLPDLPSERRIVLGRSSQNYKSRLCWAYVSVDDAHKGWGFWSELDIDDYCGQTETTFEVVVTPTRYAHLLYEKEVYEPV